MPPKTKPSGKKSNKADDDFDKLLAEASKAVVVAEKPKKQQKTAGTDGTDETVETKPKSTADHPENPYPQAALPNLPRQTWPEPTVLVADLYRGTTFPKGILTPHPLEINSFRESSEEKRAAERLLENNYEDLRHAAEVHRQVRAYAHSFVKPGITLLQVADRIEKKLEELIGKDGKKRGQAFPTGVSVNQIAAHYTPNTGDQKVVLTYDDVLKIDFGTQINGRIIDSAWTVNFDHKYDPLVNATKEATAEGIKQAGIDVRICDVSAAIQEVMESFECDLFGTTGGADGNGPRQNNKGLQRVKPLKNLNGHNIVPYYIHGGKSVPLVKDADYFFHEGKNAKMEEGELYAIETFGSVNGKGVVYEDGECSHYMCDKDVVNDANRLATHMSYVRNDKGKQLLKHIDHNFGTLAFCRKWLDRQGQDKHLMALNSLCEAGIVIKCPPLVDTKGSYTAQTEHTFILKPTAKEVLSKGSDY
eukprot:GILI01013161.1.p1 GENE.GILI01013161.1~~GILI01013161.1.p1  ORF type:complete len:498 (-),score=111.75 GILI01013161.1:109-1533(-)